MLIYNVWHHRLFDELLNDLSKEDKQAIICFGVNEAYPKEYNPESDFNILYEYNLPFYEDTWQKQGYCQTSCMYHVYNNRETLNYSLSSSYIGFMQYDMKVDKDAFAYWKERIAASPNTRIIFHEITVRTFFAFKKEPSLETHALSHYNNFFSTNLSVSDLVSHPKCKNIPVVHTFIIPVDMFERMMEWMTEYMRAVEKEVAQTRKYPFKLSQAEYFELVHGMFLIIECMNDDTIMEPIEKLRHVWPLYHNKTEFQNYKTQVL